MLLIILLSSQLAFGFENWVAGSKFKLPHTAYDIKIHCESSESLPCVQKGDKDERHFKVVNGVVVVDAAGKALADADDIIKANKINADKARVNALRNKLRERRDGGNGPVTSQDLKDIIELLLGE